MGFFGSISDHTTTLCAFEESLPTMFFPITLTQLFFQFAVDAVLPNAFDRLRPILRVVVNRSMLLVIAECRVTILTETVESLRSFAGLLFGLLKLVLLLLVFCFSLSHSYNYNLN